MTVLWKSKKPLTTSEIVEITPNRTWHEGSIFVIMKRLVKKGAVILESYKPTAGKHARVYKPIISTEDYVIKVIEIMDNSGMDIDFDVLSDRLKNFRGGQRNGN